MELPEPVACWLVVQYSSTVRRPRCYRSRSLNTLRTVLYSAGHVEKDALEIDSYCYSTSILLGITPIFINKVVCLFRPE